MRGRGWSIRLPLLAAMLLAVLLAPVPPGVAHTCAPEGDVDLDGSLLVPSGSGLSRVTLGDRRVRRLAVTAGGLVNHVARSVDRRQLAVARVSQPDGHPVSGADILVTGAGGGQPIWRVDRIRPGEVLGAPAWLPDGGLLFHVQDIVGPSAGSRLDRVDAGGNNRRPYLDDAAEPAVSGVDGSVAYVAKRGGDRLVVRRPDGGETTVVGAGRFLALAFPRFSPDGSRIAFAAVGGPAGRTAPGPVGLGGLAARPVAAHGDPWDIWLARPDGSDVRRLTAFYDDDPSPAWSPDGRWVAVFSGEALHVVEVDGTRDFCILGSGGYGGLEWDE